MQHLHFAHEAHRHDFEPHGQAARSSRGFTAGLALCGRPLEQAVYDRSTLSHRGDRGGSPARSRPWPRSIIFCLRRLGPERGIVQRSKQRRWASSMLLPSKTVPVPYTTNITDSPILRLDHEDFSACPARAAAAHRRPSLEVSIVIGGRAGSASDEVERSNPAMYSQRSTALPSAKFEVEALVAERHRPAPGPWPSGSTVSSLESTYAIVEPLSRP